MDIWDHLEILEKLACSKPEVLDSLYNVLFENAYRLYEDDFAVAHKEFYYTINNIFRFTVYRLIENPSGMQKKAELFSVKVERDWILFNPIISQWNFIRFRNNIKKEFQKHKKKFLNDLHTTFNERLLVQASDENSKWLKEHGFELALYDNAFYRFYYFETEESEALYGLTVK